MTENETILLPVLPLPDAVVLPHMVVTTGVESDEARSAIKAARDGDHRLLLVPKVDGRYARVGTVAKVDEYGTEDNGQNAGKKALAFVPEDSQGVGANPGPSGRRLPRSRSAGAQLGPHLASG